MNSNYDDYTYDDTSRRTVRRSAAETNGERDARSASGADELTASPRASERRTRSARERRPGNSEGTGRSSLSGSGRSSSRGSDSYRSGGSFGEGKSSGILYDARGARVRKPVAPGGFLRTLLFFIIPYLVINGLIFFLVTATPKVEIKVGDTDNYRTVKVTVTTGGLLPIKDVQITMESNPLECEKDGSTYTAEVAQNGTVYAVVTSVNGMTSSAYADISSLDDTPPVIDETGCKIENDVLTFTISDTQSGVDFDSIYATSPEGEKIVPMEVNKERGIVKIPMIANQMEIHFEDMVGNAREATITANEILVE